ncbi:MAG: hypothetical protein ACO1SV_16575 [Fimbriimonas sp.]
MKQIRENVFQVTHSELGKPSDKGWLDLPESGKLLLDAADMHFIREMTLQGYEPTFFISRSPVMGGEFVVVSRQWNDRI